jgi:glycosyltransferase involved in cell wall biosynthesis
MRLWQQVNLMNSLGPVFVFSIGRSIGDQSTPIISEWIHIDEGKSRTPRIPSFLRGIKIFNPPQFPGVGDFADRDLNRRLREFLVKINPDLIMLSHWGNAMPEALRGRKNIILDSHNIESKLWSDQMATKSVGYAIRYYRFSRREVDLSKRASVTWVTSDLDREFLLKMSRKPLAVTVWPNAIDLDYYEPSKLAKVAEPANFGRSFPTLIFVGYMAYGPNHDAACALISGILPKLREKYPTVRIFIVGKDPRSELLALARHEENVFVTGTVADVRPFVALSDLVVVPLTVGGGTRLKLLEAFACRVAVVSTAKGAEGIATATSAEVTIADSIQEMVIAIIELLSDEEKRAAQIDRAYELVKTQFSWQALIGRLPKEISRVLG